MIHLDSEFTDRRSIDRATNRTLLYKRKMEGGNRFAFFLVSFLDETKKYKCAENFRRC